MQKGGKVRGRPGKALLKDQGKHLLDRLSYSINDANEGKQPNHSIPIRGTKGFKSILEGTKSLESAVRRYFEFMKQKVGS